MDSVASDWFWFWLPLLVVVVVRALAVPSSLLVSWSWLTRLSHHSSILHIRIGCGSSGRHISSATKRRLSEEKVGNNKSFKYCNKSSKKSSFFQRLRARILV